MQSPWSEPRAYKNVDEGETSTCAESRRSTHVACLSFSHSLHVLENILYAEVNSILAAALIQCVTCYTGWTYAHTFHHMSFKWEIQAVPAMNLLYKTCILLCGEGRLDWQDCVKNMFKNEVWIRMMENSAFSKAESIWNIQNIRDTEIFILPAYMSIHSTEVVFKVTEEAEMDYFPLHLSGTQTGNLKLGLWDIYWLFFWNKKKGWGIVSLPIGLDLDNDS